MTFPIEKNVPIPSRCCGGSLYPFHEMKVGDSFLAPFERRSSIQTQATRLKKTTGLTFKTRKTREGVRVWRIA